MNENKTNINWYPGHMAKTKRNITDIQMAGVSKTNKIISLTGFGDINDYQKSVDVSGAGINKL